MTLVAKYGQRVTALVWWFLSVPILVLFSGKGSTYSSVHSFYWLHNCSVIMILMSGDTQVYTLQIRYSQAEMNLLLNCFCSNRIFTVGIVLTELDHFGRVLSPGCLSIAYHSLHILCHRIRMCAFHVNMHVRLLPAQACVVCYLNRFREYSPIYLRWGWEHCQYPIPFGYGVQWTHEYGGQFTFLVIILHLLIIVFPAILSTHIMYPHGVLLFSHFLWKVYSYSLFTDIFVRGFSRGGFRQGIAYIEPCAFLKRLLLMPYLYSII